MNKKTNLLIWIIEDDSGACFVYKQMLELKYRIHFFKSVSEFMSHLATKGASEKPSLIIADLGLPDGSYLNFLEKNENFSGLHCPIMIVSAIDNIETLRNCFKFGVAEYITKPFNQSELIVKIEKLTQTNQLSAVSPIPTLRIDYNSGEVYSRDGKKSFELTKREMQIISVFLANKAGVPRSEFMETVWGRTTVTGKAFDVHLTHLRTKLAPLNIFISFRNGKYYLEEQTSPQSAAI